MLTKLLVIQKINADGSVDIFQAHSDNFQWAFETEREIKKGDKEYFPFTIFGNARVVKRRPGPETITEIVGEMIKFCDDYGVPDGTVIAILFPSNYIVDIIKFKDQPYIPVGLIGQVSLRPPGQMQVLYNKLEKKCAVVLHIHEKALFGVKCAAKRLSDEDFPENANKYVDDLFDISISRELLDVRAIQTEDLKIINDVLSHVDLQSINETLNEILDSLKSGNKSKIQFLVEKFGKLISNGASLGSSLTTLVDSYNNVGGGVHKFIAQILKYAFT